EKATGVCREGAGREASQDLAAWDRADCGRAKGRAAIPRFGSIWPACDKHGWVPDWGIGPPRRGSQTSESERCRESEATEGLACFFPETCPLGQGRALLALSGAVVTTLRH